METYEFDDEIDANSEEYLDFDDSGREEMNGSKIFYPFSF